MNLKLLLASASLSLSLGATLAFANTPTVAFKAGAWDITRTMTGGPRKQAPQTDRYCFTEAQLRADPAAPLKAKPKAAKGQKQPECTIGPATMANGKASLSTSCKGPMGKMKANMSGTYSATGFTMSGKMSMGIMSAKMTATGRHAGACAG